MENQLRTTQAKLNQSLDHSLTHAVSIVTKDYLERLERYEIAEKTIEEMDIDVTECGKFYKISKLVRNKEENYLNKLTTIVNVASSIDCSIATIIKSNGDIIDLYLGLISKNARKSTDAKRRNANATAFRGAIRGNLIGSDVKELDKNEMQRLTRNIFDKKENCYSSISGVVSLREEQLQSMEQYVQGIEKLTDSLKGQRYTIIMLADPIGSAEIQQMKQGYEMIHTHLSTFAKSSMTWNQSDTNSLSKAYMEGISNGISEGISKTQSHTSSRGTYGGMSIGGGINFVVSANLGFNFGTNQSTSHTDGNTRTSMTTKQQNKAFTDTAGISKSEGKSLQLNYENRSVKSILDKIDEQLKRLDGCENYGAFQCAAYVIAEQKETTLTVASNYNALMRGEKSCVQSSHINLWDGSKAEKIGQYLSNFVHPRFWYDKKKGISVTPAAVMSGNELAIQIGLPKKSIPGVTVISMASFGRNIEKQSGRQIALGNFYHMGNDEGDSFGNVPKVRIDVDSLTMHTFITGSTGKGKSSAVYHILDKLKNYKKTNSNEKIKFMVIEPVKGEYKNRFGNDEDVYVYGTNHKKMPLLKINPFSFPEDIHILEHIDRLIDIFNVCWPMYAAMPAVLKDAMERAYLMAGWDLEMSECRYEDSDGNPLYPSFVDLLDQIENVMEDSAYSSDSKSDYKGALCTRIRSLTNGLYRQIFTNDEIKAQQLFDENVIIDLSRTGSTETKSLIMGLLVMKLQEYRMANAKAGNEALGHVTVLEEAHNLLKRTSTEQMGEGANLMGKSVEMLANAIAEMRTYGEGFFIVDQAPGLLDLSVIRNTNTKIIFGLPDLEDRKLVGRAANLNEDQILELSRLKTFVAAVYQNNWLEPVLCNMDRNFEKISEYHFTKQLENDQSERKILEYLLLPIEKRDQLEKDRIEQLIKQIDRLSVSTEIKIAFRQYIKAHAKEEIQRLRGKIVYQLFNSDTAFALSQSMETRIEEWYNCMKTVLKPDIMSLNEKDQQKVIAILVREQMSIAGKKDLYKRFMNYI